MTRRMIFDVESVGLAGEGFAVGWVVFEGEQEVSQGLFACVAQAAHGSDAGARWINENVPRRLLYPAPSDEIFRDTPAAMRTAFWNAWQEAGGREVELWADCGWPVEARFLNQAVEDSANYRSCPSDALVYTREMQGPYPLNEISTLFRACRALGHPVADVPPTEPHNPLEDARASAKTLLLCLKALGIAP